MKQDFNIDKARLDKDFIKRLKSKARGVTNGDRLLSEFLKYYNSIEPYISDLEMQNTRLEIENSKLTKKYIELEDAYFYVVRELQSIIIKSCRIIKRKL